MSSVTSYCPTLSGSWGGGYEGGVHLFTPRKCRCGGIKKEKKKKKAGRGCEKAGDKEAVWGDAKRETKKKGGVGWITKRRHCQ